MAMCLLCKLFACSASIITQSKCLRKGENHP
nr:MAG TPA: hypothetical protein [Caudoviricetes sp.]